MAFKKGNKLGKGRVSPNKATLGFKEAVTNLLNYATPNFVNWMEQLDSPEKRLDYALKFAEFAYPKMARVEHTGEDGGPVATVEVTPEQRRQLLQKMMNGSSRTSTKK